MSVDLPRGVSGLARGAAGRHRGERPGGPAAAGPALLAAVVIVLLVLPGLGLPRLTLNLGASIVLFGLAAAGLNLMLGYAGMLSLGGALYLGAGGYIVGLTTQFWGWPMTGALLAAIAGSLLLALLLGTVLVGLSGHYFAVANLGLATALDALLVAFPQATGGTSGLTTARTLDLGVGTVSSDLGWYLTAVVAALIGLLVFGWTVAGKRGRILRLVRADQLAASVLGVRTYRTKLLVYVVAAFFPALAGALLFPFSGLVTPDQAGAVQSVQLVALIVVGGVGYWLGGFVGALVILWLQALVDTSGNWSLLIYALVFLLVAFYAPSGIVGTVRQGWRRLAGPGKPAPPPPGTAPPDPRPDGTVQDGPRADDAVPAGARTDGTVPATTRADDAVPDGARTDGTVPAGASAGDAAPAGPGATGRPPADRANRAADNASNASSAGNTDNAGNRTGDGTRGQRGLTVRDVGKRFGGVTAVRGVSLEVRPGTIVALIGSNGAGKSTLVNLISGIDRPDAGTVLLDGRDLTALRAPERTRLGIARTFQVPRLVDELTVADNLVLGEEAAEPSFLRRSRAREARQRQRALDRLAEASLSELAGRRAGSLGTGERKFVELVRALIADPVVCLLDEPAVGLSLDEIAHLTDWLRALRDSGAAVLVIDHNLDFIHRLADQVYVMDLGQIVTAGSAAELVGNRETRATLLAGAAGLNQQSPAQQGTAQQGTAQQGTAQQNVGQGKHARPREESHGDRD
jgi:ABC-type branched-subunit amino acid transport system ATPase component/ABC-type branched-subunit amino acid transport system permease subunit